ncbi:helix-turn-helix domain-containing protein [Rhizosphaericola mali]|uniref:Helix-turn-helix transcriptional regulator n=1 Tax=Rhizosphaericola mali TaxID=2545455 RepID=A0A5P2G220_9BACT|nr:AraC family transcriptional regulator [Rhizosphaericola mali]QES88139.1 helix-turn-helix transcriptional regulator [Rhizosphaericola mali]
MNEKLVKFNYHINEIETEMFFKMTIQLLEINIENPDYTIERLIKDIHLSRTQLHRKIKDKVGISTTDFIKIFKLKKSISFLEEGYNSSEVAFKVGFESPSYYSKCFGELFGLSPTNYQKKRVKNFFAPFQNIIKY